MDAGQVISYPDPLLSVLGRKSGHQDRMIQFPCPNCRVKLRAPLEAAGRVAKCNKCDSKVRIPTPKPRTASPKTTASDTAATQATASQVEASKKSATANTPVSKHGVPQTSGSKRSAAQPPNSRHGQSKVVKANPWDLLLTQIREEFDGKVPRNHLNLPYQVSLLLVAVVMVLLPILYVGLIVGACYGMYWYWTDILTSGMKNLPRGRGGLFGMLALISPLFGGSVMILFMVKPLFFIFVRPPEPRRRSIKRASEPALFELVDRICESTRSPKPKRIDIDNEVNASASFRRGLLSLLGKDLVLTIGAPLIAGMNTRQLTGVLAHEFGHFSQGGGMKSTYLIRGINAWFARVVYQRDQLDEMLDNAISESDYRISLILLVAKLFVVVSRAILWVFMMGAHVISCMMMRQMEYDADRYEAHVAGSEQFADTSRQLTVLMAGQQNMYELLGKSLQENTLLDDLPGITKHCASKVTSSEQKRIEKLSSESTDSLFSTHPTDEKRIAAARKQGADGLFQIERPARELMKNFNAICTGVSLDFYRNHLGVLADPAKLQRVSFNKSE